MAWEGAPKCTEKKGKTVLDLSGHVGCTKKFMWKVLATHLGVVVTAFRMHIQFIQKLLEVLLGVAVS